MISENSVALLLSLERFKVVIGLAIFSDGSDTANPIVLLPRSTPSNRMLSPIFSANWLGLQKFSFPVVISFDLFDETMF
jgi:hypothetical protein